MPNKLCIIYTGSWNLSDLSLLTHKPLFENLREHNINYDVFISVSNEILIKHPDKTLLINNFSKLSKHNCFDFLEEKNIWQGSESREEATWNWYHINKIVDTNYIKKKFNELVGESNIKHIDFRVNEDDITIKDSNGNSKNHNNYGDGHNLPYFFDTNYFKRLTRVSSIVNQDEYFSFINVRPDFYMENHEKIIKHFTNPINNELQLLTSYRLDFFHISKQLLVKFFNKNKYLKICESKEIYEIKKSNPYTNNVHIEIYFEKIFQLLNISVQKNFIVGFKLDINELEKVIF